MASGSTIALSSAAVIDALALGDGSLVVIHAPPGYGKSSLARSLVHMGHASAAHLDVDRGQLPALLDQLASGKHALLPVVTTTNAIIASQIALRFPAVVRVVTATELRLNADSLARQLGTEASDPRILRAIELSQGWPLAARLALARPDLPSDRFDYLLKSYFDGLEGQVFTPVELKMIAAVADFDELRVSVLRSLFDDEALIEMLRGLAIRGAFIHECIGTGGSFTIEPAFAAYLRRRFEGARPNGAAANKARALARLGYVAAALRVASSSRQEDSLVDVIGTIGGMRMVMSLGFDAAAYLEVPAVRASDHPEVRAARIYMAIQMGRVGHARDLLGPAAAASCDVDLTHRSLELVELALRLYENQDIPLDCIADYEHRHAAALYDDPIARATLQQIRASSHFLRGDYRQSFVCARYAMEVSTGLGAPLLAHYAKFYVVLNQMRAGHLLQARELLEDTVALSEKELGQDNPQACQALLLLARIHVEQLDNEAAESIISRYSDAAELYANWRDAAELVVTSRARLLQRSSGLAAAVAFLDERQTRFLHRRMLICAQICALLKAQIFFEAGRYGEALEELGARRDPVSAEEHAHRKASAFLAMRIAVRTRFETFDRSAFDMLAQQLEDGGDAIIRLRVALARYEISRNEGRISSARAALKSGVQLATRSDLRLTLTTDPGRLWDAIDEDAPHSGLTDEETLFLTACRPEFVRSIDEARSCGTGLSPREQQVLGFLADGLSSKEMARNLNISVGTVKGYRRKLYDKLNIYRRSDAVLAARQLGLDQFTLEKKRA